MERSDAISLPSSQLFGDRVTWNDDGTFVVDGVVFYSFLVVSPRFNDRGLVQLSKGAAAGGPHELLKSYLTVLESHQGGRILELGMLWGGSVLLASLFASPEMLVGVDIAERPDRSALVEEILRDRRLTDRVHMYWNTDQSDRERLRAIIDREFDGSVDLVIDDASHQYVPSRTSFEVLFPSVAVGGEYVIEDWPCDGRFADLMAGPRDASPRPATDGPGDPWQLVDTLLPDALADPGHSAHTHVVAMLAQGLAAPDGPLGEAAREVLARASAAGVTQQVLDRVLERPQPPLSRLVLQLVLLHEVQPDIVSHLVIEPSTVRVTRGPTALGADFSLGTPHTNLYGQLADWPPQRARPPSRR